MSVVTANYPTMKKRIYFASAARKTVLTLLISAVVMTVLVTSSCNPKKKDTDFLIKVDSINVPNVLTAGIPFDIKFYGTIGYNDCVTFKTFSKTIKERELRIGAWGTYPADMSNCNDALVLLNGSVVTVTVSTPGNYDLYIDEPDNTSIHRLLPIK